jgi:hypothetical protein
VIGAPPAAQRPGRLRGAAGWLGAAALVGAVGAATLGGLLLGGNPLLAILPAALALGLLLLHRMPLRATGALLLLLLLVPDDRGESAEQWHTPIAYLGDLMHYRLDAVAGVPGLAITGMELLCALLLWAAIRRRGVEARVDQEGRLGGPPAMWALYALYLLGVAWALGNGILHGQGLVPWKIRNLLHPLLLALVFGTAFRGPIDHRLIARVVVFAACFRAILAVVVQRISIAQTGGKFATATSHGDSVLFAVAIFILLVELMERPPRFRALRTFLVLPILLAGAQQNGRRLVWVMLLQMLALAYLLSPFRGWKRSLTRVTIFALPVALLYVVAGWNGGSRIFAPVQTLRSVADTSVDHSAYWREVENWNIAVTIREHPLAGAGLGGHYVEHMHNDDISSVYREYREWPHNTVLGMLLLMGLGGFVAVWSLWVGLAFLLVRAYRFAQQPETRVAAMSWLGAIMACHVLAYGDTGGHYPQYKVFMGLALAMGGKLATATGAWPEDARAAQAG